MRTRGRVFLLDDDDLIVSMLARALKGQGYEVFTETAPGGALERIRRLAPDIAMLDIKLPGKSGIEILQEIVEQGIGTQVLMLTSDDSAETAVRAMKLGAADYITKPFDLDEVKIVVRNLIEKGKLQQEVEYLRKVSAEALSHEIVGASAAIRELQEKAQKMVEAGIGTILITGESGTGKEVIARHIHHLLAGSSATQYAPFIGINCAALPEPLIESELFGHEKGAFTDARSDKRGIFEMGTGGSILLDEIGEMRPMLQSKLLRVLEERTFRKVGGNLDIPLRAMVFATTNRNLAEAVEAGDFRMDLYYRLNTFSLHIPPLRERREDIPVLIRHYLARYCNRYNKPGPNRVSPDAETLLLSYGWPGNVRELRNVIERIVVMESGEELLPGHLPKEILVEVDSAETTRSGHGFTLPDQGIFLEELEKDLILQALDKTGGNKTLAAKLLGISYDSLRYQVRKFGLE